MDWVKGMMRRIKGDSWKNRVAILEKARVWKEQM